MNFSLVACKQFLKDYVDNDSDVAFSSEDFDVIASEISRTNTPFEFEQLRLLITKLKNTGRLNKPQENKMVPKQTPAERTEIVRQFFHNNFATRFPNLEPIFSSDGKIVCPASFVIIQGDFHKAEVLRADVIQDIIMKYESVLVQKKAPVIVEVERQPTPEELKKRKFQEAHDAGLLNSAKHNRTELDDEWNRGKSRPLPLTEQDRVAINVHNARVDEVIRDTMSSVNNYTGYSHARTAERRAELTALFDKFKLQVKDEESALKLQRTIADKINSYDRSTSGSIR
jgi:hypothetical protein